MMRAIRLVTAILGVAVLLTPTATAQVRPQIEEGAVEVPKGDLFIRNLDAVWTANDTVYEGVSILIRDGVIRRIGPDLEAPSNVPLIEGAGFTAIPGLIDEHSHIAMRAVNECTAPFVPEIRTIGQWTRSTRRASRSTGRSRAA
jgi:imidazolonepropionase-like amidohydrolase